MATRVWKSMFGVRDDLEMKLQNLASEEKAVHARIKRRASSFHQLVRHVIKISMFLEIFVVIYAIVMGREPDLIWQIRSLIVLPVIAVPILAALIYTILTSLRKLLEEKDKNRLEQLREERRTKINELKEKSNYYATQVLIQRYDLDPAEKAAAATVLASKLGTESGLKLSIEDQSNTGISSHGLRYRKSSSVKTPNHAADIIEDSLNYDNDEVEENNNKDFDKYRVSEGNNDAWFAQIAAMLVGEHPSQCFALICSNCYMHNGLARKEDLPFIRYYCPHCHALNGSQQNNEEEREEVNDGSEMETPVSAITGQSAASSSSTVVEQVNERNRYTQEEEDAPHDGNDN